MQPYYTDALTTIYHGECLAIMAELAPASFDAIICDPPYGTTACAWDSVIPFEPMWEQLKRLIKPRGAIVLFGSQPFTSRLICSNIEWFKQEWIWEKSRPVNFLNANKRSLSAHENVIIFSEGQCTYNPQKWNANPIFVERRKSFDKLVSNGENYGGALKRRHKDDGTRYPLSIIPIPNEWQEDMHPTQKPLALLEYLVKTYTNEGENILDFTFGSGTTLRAAKNLKRHSVGIELLEQYCAAAVRRLAPTFEEPLRDETPVAELGPLFALQS